MLKATAIIDTNLLLLKFAGRVAPRLIGSHRKLRGFRSGEEHLLDELLKPFRYFVTTPHILTECSNHIGTTSQNMDVHVLELLGATIKAQEEKHVVAKDIVSYQQFSKLGLADTVLLELAYQGVTVITAEFQLAQMLEKEGLPVVNFNHHRRQV